MEKPLEILGGTHERMHMASSIQIKATRNMNSSHLQGQFLDEKMRGN